MPDSLLEPAAAAAIAAASSPETLFLRIPLQVDVDAEAGDLLLVLDLLPPPVPPGTDSSKLTDTRVLGGDSLNTVAIDLPREPEGVPQLLPVASVTW